MEWTQTLVIALIGPIVTALGLIYQQRRNDRRELALRTLEADEREREREHQRREAVTARRFDLDERWRDERRNVYSEHVELLQEGLSSAMRYRLRILHVADDEFCPTDARPSTFRADFISELFASAATVEILGSNHARETSKRAVALIQGLEASAQVGFGTVGTYKYDYAELEVVVPKFVEAARTDIVAFVEDDPGS